MTDKADTGLMGAALRQPFAILGAIGFISVLKNVMILPEDLAFVIEGFRAVTHPILGFLLSWLPVEVPGWLKDYLVMGFVCAGAWLRLARIEEESWAETFGDPGLWVNLAWFLVGWPAMLSTMLLRVWLGEVAELPALRVFFETFVWAALILAVSYAVAFAG